MADNTNKFPKLQFIHHLDTFASLEAIKKHVRKYALESNFRETLYAEPLVFRYGNDTEKHTVLVIAADGDGVTYNDNYTFIDADGLNESLDTLERSLEETKEKVDENTKDIEGLDTTVTSLNEQVKEIVEQLKKDELELSVVGSETKTTITETIEHENGATEIKTDVKVPETVTIGNITNIPNNIVFDKNGIYTVVNLYYIKEENKLVLNVNGKEQSKIQLSDGKYVAEGKYDTVSECLTFKYADGETFNVPLTELINEWKPQDTKSIALIRTKVTGSTTNEDSNKTWQDVLTAELKVSSDENNSLEIHKDGVYVPKVEIDGKTIKKDADDKLTVVIDPTSDDYFSKSDKGLLVSGIKEAINRVEDNLSALSHNVTHTKGEGAIKIDKTANGINVVKLNIATGETVLTQDDNTLKTTLELYYDEGTNTIQLLGKNRQLITSIKAADFVASGILEDAELDADHNILKLKFNTGKVIDVDLKDLFTYADGDGIEINEGKINIKINEYSDEKFLVATADGLNTVGIKEAINDAVNTEKKRAEEAENAINNAITLETTRATEAEAALASEISNNKTALETKINVDVDNEKTRAEGKESELLGQITTNKVYSGDKSIVVTPNDNGTDISVNIDTNTLVENNGVISVAISGEYVTTENGIVISGITNAINETVKTASDTLAEQLAAENTRALNAEGVIDGKLTDEVSRATSKENELKEAIESEKNRALSAEADLGRKIDEDIEVEKDRALLAEGTLETQITSVNNALVAEKTRAEGEEGKIRTEIVSAVNTETVRAEKEETALGTKIDSEVNKLNTTIEKINSDIATEANDRKASDEAILATVDSKFDIARALKSSHGTVTIEQTPNDTSFDVNVDGKTIVYKPNAEGGVGSIGVNVDDSSEYLTVTDKGLNVSGINNAIANEVNNAETRVNNKIDDTKTALEGLVTAEYNRAKAAEEAIDAKTVIDTVSRDNALFRTNNGLGVLLTQDNYNILEIKNGTLRSHVTLVCRTDMNSIEFATPAITKNNNGQNRLLPLPNVAADTNDPIFVNSSVANERTTFNVSMKYDKETLKIANGGTLYVAIDNNGEFLSKTANGLKVSGVSAAIDNKLSQPKIDIQTLKDKTANVEFNKAKSELTVNGTTVKIDVGSVIDDMYYTDGKIVITFTDNSGNKDSVNVPISDFFKPVSIGNNESDSCLVFNLSDDLKLTGRVVVSTEVGNILKKTNNGLFVDTTTIETLVQNETTRATEAEATLLTEITNNKSTLESKIDALTARLNDLYEKVGYIEGLLQGNESGTAGLRYEVLTLQDDMGKVKALFNNDLSTLDDNKHSNNTVESNE